MEYPTRHGTVLIDEGDLPIWNSFPWVTMSGKGRLYVVTGRGILLHRVILGASPGQIVDHANGNGLDNRRQNLRFCSHSQNMANRKKTANSASIYLGVFASREKWRAQLSKNGIKKQLGCYATQEGAARAYDAAARIYHGEFARLNFT